MKKKSKQTAEYFGLSRDSGERDINTTETTVRYFQNETKL